MEHLGIHQLSLSKHRHGGPVPRDSPELRRRIQSHGIVDPVVVRPQPGEQGKYEILINPESYLAAGKLGIHEVPVVIRDDIDDDEAAEIVRSHYNVAKDNPIDEAEWYQERLAEQTEPDSGAANIAKLARLTGKSRSQISRSLALLSLPVVVQEYFRRGELSAAHGRFLVKLKVASKQIALAERAVKNKLSVRDLEALVNKTPRRRDSPPADRHHQSQTKDPDTLRLERDITDIVGSPVSIDSESGTMTIDFFRNYETLDGILARLGYNAKY